MEDERPKAMIAQEHHVIRELREAILQHRVVALWQEVSGTVWDARQAARRLSESLVESVGLEGLFLSRTATPGLAGVAACAWCPVGLDAESGGRCRVDAALRARALHPDESTTDPVRSGVGDPLPFFGLWARKEAALKALGVGLGLDPRLIAVGWPTRVWQSVLSPSGEYLEVRSLTAPKSISAAIAVSVPRDSRGAGSTEDCVPILAEYVVRVVRGLPETPLCVHALESSSDASR